MPETVRRRVWPPRVAAGSAVFIAALGLMVLVGWFSHNTSLIQLRPDLPPMTRNAAGCFLLCGLALLTIVLKGPKWFVATCAGIVSAASVLTIGEYVFRMNSGIDELLGPSYLVLRVSSPGRMAPVVAICFALGSIALLIGPNLLPKHAGLLWGLIGSMIAAAGIGTSLAVVLGSSEAPDWSDVTHVAIHTALGLWTFGFGILALAWLLDADQASTPRWLPISVALGVATSTLALWQALIADGYAPFAPLPVALVVGGCLMAPTLGATIYQTQRAHTQKEKLRASERNLREITNAIPTFIHVLRPDGSVLYVNQPALDYSGLTMEDALKEDYRTRVFHPEDLERIREERQDALTRPVLFENEQRALGKDGKYRWFLARYNPLLNEQGEIDRWYVASFDIEDRKRAEAEIEQAYLRLAEAQRVSKTGSFITDLMLDEHNWSEELRRIFELDPGTRVTSESIRALFHPEDLPVYEEAFKRAVDGLDRDIDISYRIITPAGNVKHLHAVTHVLEKIAGRPVFIGAIQDVTESKAAEQALTRARAELAHMARVTTLSALTASISHEVNQPLSGIITNASICLRMLAADPPNVDGARETTQRTIRDGHRAADVITRLRALFTKKEITLEAVDLNEAAREVIALSLSDLQRNRVTLRSQLADDLPLVAGDRVQLQQVILNLVRNASDAMSTVADRPRHLVIKTEPDNGDQVRLSVQDAGVGFDPQAMKKLFETFYTTKNGGMGIGLSVSRSIIESHHGRLWATPNDGPGSTFSFSIPRESSNQY